MTYTIEKNVKLSKNVCQSEERKTTEKRERGRARAIAKEGEETKPEKRRTAPVSALRTCP